MNEKSEPFVPKALRDVWAWKDAIYREVSHLPVEEAVRVVMEKAAKTARKYEWMPARDCDADIPAVAESRAPYGKEKN
ncbi:MAG: hypothetical protein HY343_00195 [Lentisphaerae bacterium]|nr:hypothetical protein [Lentisphaerota bacterium]